MVGNMESECSCQDVTIPSGNSPPFSEFWSSGGEQSRAASCVTRARDSWVGLLLGAKTAGDTVAEDRGRTCSRSLSPLVWGAEDRRASLGVALPSALT